MPDHKCSTCKHYESAPMWKKGWCRNPLLYSPQQSHLVGEDDLDCNRGMGSYWEGLDAATDDDPGRFTPPPPRNIAPAVPLTQAQGVRRPAQTRSGVDPLAGRRASEEPVGRPRVRPSAKATEPLRSSDPEGYTNNPQEHYSWGDYLRRSYPAIGVILLLGAFWVWSARQLAGGPQPTPTVQATAPTAEAPPVASVVVITPSTTAPVAGAAAPTPTLPTPPPGVIAPGAKVVVTTSGAGANIRQEPTVNAAKVTAQDDGTSLTITGASRDADGFTWWPVRGDGFTGWVAGALISPAP